MHMSNSRVVRDFADLEVHFCTMTIVTDLGKQSVSMTKC